MRASNKSCWQAAKPPLESICYLVCLISVRLHIKNRTLERPAGVCEYFVVYFFLLCRLLRRKMPMKPMLSNKTLAGSGIKTLPV
jgi:hypothetical protein